MFASGFHRATFFLGIASIVVAFLAIRDWLGLIAAILLCVPAGVVLMLLPAMVIGTLHNHLPLSARVVGLSALPIGIGIAIWSLTSDASGAVKALGVVFGIGYLVTGYGLYKQRAMAALLAHARGEATDEDMEYVRDI